MRVGSWVLLLLWALPAGGQPRDYVTVHTTPAHLRVYQLEESGWHFKGLSNGAPMKLFLGHGREVFLRFEYRSPDPLRAWLNPLLGPASPPLQPQYDAPTLEKLRASGWVVYTRVEGPALTHHVQLGAFDRYLEATAGAGTTLLFGLVGLLLVALWWRGRPRSVAWPAPPAFEAARAADYQPTEVLPALPWELSPGDCVLGYRIEARLGEGAFAVVYRVRRESDGERLAMKILRDTATLDFSTRERFQREMQAMNRLRHRSIPYLAEVGDYGRVPFLVMEYVEGQSLRERIQAGDLSYRARLEALRDLAAALRFAHQHDILHRDVKPENALYRRDGSVCLSDFGLARGLENSNLTMEGSVLGTPGYLAPEVIRGEPASPKSDQYSLGCLAFELLSGRLPYPGSGPMEQLVGHLQHPVPLLQSVGKFPNWINETVRRMMDKNPEKRFPSMQEVEELFERMLASTQAR